MTDIEISIRECHHREHIDNHNLINISSDKILEHIVSDNVIEIIDNESGNNNHLNNILEERSDNNLSILIGHKSHLVINDHNTNFCFTIVATMSNINVKNCTTFIFNKHFAENIFIRIIKEKVINDIDLIDNNVFNKRGERATNNCLIIIINIDIVINKHFTIKIIMIDMHFAVDIYIVISNVINFNCDNHILCLNSDFNIDNHINTHFNISINIIIYFIINHGINNHLSDSNDINNDINRQ